MSAGSAAADERARMGLRLSARRLALLNQTMERLVEAATTRQVTDVIAEACEGICGPCMPSLALLDETPGKLEQRTPVDDALRNGEVVVTGTRITVPLMVRRRILGAMGLDFEREPSLDVDQRELLRTIGRVGAEALRRARSCERSSSSAEREVTAEREAGRQRLRKAARDSAFVQATSVILWVYDASGRAIEDSPSWRAFTGVSTVEGSTAWEWAAYVHPDDRERVLAAWNEAFDGKRLFACEARVRRRDGVYGWVLARAVPVRDERGEVVEWVGASTDISERKRAEEQRDATLHLAEQFMGILSHDLRNPIGAIQAGAQLMKRKAEDPSEVRRLADRVAASARRMGSLVAQMLDLARVRLGTGLKVERRQTNLGHLVGAAVDELRLVYPAHRIDCSCEADVEGWWDADRLAQVVSNLVGNALQHGDDARPVEVHLAKSGSDAVFEVRSYGTPIAPDLLPHVFDAYRQGQRRGGTSAGLGLGLYITQQIVHAHGGRIEVCSSAAKGTRFTATLPRRFIPNSPVP